MKQREPLLLASKAKLPTLILTISAKQRLAAAEMIFLIAFSVTPAADDISRSTSFPVLVIDPSVSKEGNLPLVDSWNQPPANETLPWGQEFTWRLVTFLKTAASNRIGKTSRIGSKGLEIR